jgi:hypothetical protein
VIQISPGAAAFGPARPALGIDTESPQSSKVDDDSVVTGAVAGDAVAATAHRQHGP